MYPLDQMAIIAPIIFILLMIAFPVIGIFAGWKRGLYWGGGNLLFYIIGLIVWRLAGPAIAGAIGPLIANLIAELGGSGDITPIATSVLGPIFFLIWFTLSEIIRLINYYAWYKRVVGLKQPKVNKADAKGKSAKVQRVQVNTKQGPKMKAINMVGGALCLGALTVPSTISFTNTLYYLTTSRATRATNGLSNDLYQRLNDLQSNISWFSYYTLSDTAKDFDALFSGVGLMTKEVTYKDPKTGKETQGTISQAVQGTFQEVSTMLEDVQKEGTTVEDILGEDGPMKTVADCWNSLLGNNKDDIVPLFESTNVTTFVAPLLETMFGQQQQMDDTKIDEYFLKTDSVFNQIVDKYNDETWQKDNPDSILKTIEVSEASFQAIEDAVMKTFDLSNVEDKDKAEAFEGKIADVIQLIFVKPQNNK